MSFYISYLLHQAWRNKVVTLSIVFVFCSCCYRCQIESSGSSVASRNGIEVLFYDIEDTTSYIRLRTVKDNSLIKVAIKGVEMPKLSRKSQTCETVSALRVQKEMRNILSRANSIKLSNVIKKDGYLIANITYDQKDLLKELGNKGMVYKDNRVKISENEWCNIYYRYTGMGTR